MAEPTQADVAATLTPHWTPEDFLGPMGLKEFFFSNDYRIIGLKGILTSVVMLALGGLFAMTFRTELMQPDIQFFGARPRDFVRVWDNGGRGVAAPDDRGRRDARQAVLS